MLPSNDNVSFICDIFVIYLVFLYDMIYPFSCPQSLVKLFLCKVAPSPAWTGWVKVAMGSSTFLPLTSLLMVEVELGWLHTRYEDRESRGSTHVRIMYIHHFFE
jgi:hypothetical protein